MKTLKRRTGKTQTTYGRSRVSHGFVRDGSATALLSPEVRTREEVGFLDVGYVKTCECSPNHINCLTPKEWMKSQIGVWQFFYEGRDIRDKSLHPATFPIALARKCIELFTHRGEPVVTA